ncbi:hypothetical protein [Roseiconus lacunae]|uniref:Recombinase domain-containing protein n=1 Tax=Roseiconus lacunae TaxID=2605694 RepID=A0ABT7PGE9_9BACT|nr:hypothetical protein [Roseiconus lacunae]MDM4015558.1 hypothetical protein [Roseiconus lacunae]
MPTAYIAIFCQAGKTTINHVVANWKYAGNTTALNDAERSRKKVSGLVKSFCLFCSWHATVIGEGSSVTDDPDHSSATAAMSRGAELGEAQRLRLKLGGD